ncbi:uncharacterized protein LOC116254793 isoform X2 [Nymphaea colorata]|uniref:uncharacterized protein LOC116254793 isoform X2 n=1 Tax=Nymphaea colorata TaxID=210225 RepID=UPI00214E8490|nr:uncharacterized protein LOC116254793 isoform X2 [Nymphaea colorata]
MHIKLCSEVASSTSIPPSRSLFSSMADAYSAAMHSISALPLPSELNESKAELLSRIQGLKKDLQEWRLKLDTQVSTYREELSGLKKTLNVEVEQLRSEFEELRGSLLQQQEDTKCCLSNLEMRDMPNVENMEKAGN